MAPLLSKQDTLTHPWQYISTHCLGQLHRATLNGRPFCPDSVRLGRAMGSCPGLSWDAVAVRPMRGRIRLPHLVRQGLEMPIFSYENKFARPNINCLKIKIVLQPNRNCL